jgi:Holliday junction DNA helicase RuvA
VIEWIEGKICEKSPARLVIEREGIGFSIAIPLSTYEAIGEIGEKIRIYTHLSFKNEKIELFGFKTKEEKTFFSDLLLVEGIGPYTALRIISSTSFSEFKSLIFKRDVETLSLIKGISEKRANKLIIELKEKYKGEEVPTTFETNAIKALIGLGVDSKKARKLIREVKANSIEEFIKEALKKL